MSTIKNGVMDGALVLVGQAAQGRASSLVSRFVPISGIAGTAISDVGSAVAVTILARKFLPGRARMISAGAFSNAVRRLVSAVSPTAGALLGDGDGLPYGTGYDPSLVAGTGAYPELAMGAYPGGVGDSADEHYGAYPIG